MGNFKEINIKNCMCYYFNKLIKIEDFDLDNILIDQIPYKDILPYNISYQILVGPKPL